MSIVRKELVMALSKNLPQEVVNHTIDEYLHIKRQFYLRHFQPSELQGGRFAECVVRLLQFLHTGSYTPFGSYLRNTDSIINAISNDTNHTDTIRYLIPRQARILLDVRNKRDVAHVGGEVNPNYSDSLFICHAADWILSELVRHFYSCSPDEARRIVASINEIRIPIVTEVDGFVRIQNTNLDAREKSLVVLYYKQPTKVSDTDIFKWIIYSNFSRFQKDILAKLHAEALIHYAAGRCTLIDKGIAYVEKHISLDLLV